MRDPRWKVTQTHVSSRKGFNDGSSAIKDIDAPLLWSIVGTAFGDFRDQLPKGIYEVTEKQCNECKLPKKVYMGVVGEMDNDHGRAAAIMRDRGAQLFYFTPIVNRSGKIQGILGVSYTDPFYQKKLSGHPCDLCKAATDISLKLEDKQGSTIKRLLKRFV